MFYYMSKIEISIVLKYSGIHYLFLTVIILCYIVLVVFHVRFVTSKSEKSESKSSLTVLLTVVRADLDEPTCITELDNNWNSKQYKHFCSRLYTIQIISVHSPTCSYSSCRWIFGYFPK